ncbi:hypothetical protein PIB30_069578 [Stylosanthes scabra]|uniref:Uncharacterized protein n=1 Tax=Stylosanthes scabra TaxID=79078 RepID=A0ABU6RNT4_9FABA|nr:hypothetical protein [Stylosanthes scabra]
MDQISKDYHIVVYHSNTGERDADSWNPPKNSAVQLAAAITACARIHMFFSWARENEVQDLSKANRQCGDIGLDRT